MWLLLLFIVIDYWQCSRLPTWCALCFIHLAFMGVVYIFFDPKRGGGGHGVNSFCGLKNSSQIGLDHKILTRFTIFKSMVGVSLLGANWAFDWEFVWAFFFFWSTSRFNNWHSNVAGSGSSPFQREMESVQLRDRMHLK